jgi:uncharacterized metal-binding protein YceD (DUF177 family)
LTAFKANNHDYTSQQLFFESDEDNDDSDADDLKVEFVQNRVLKLVFALVFIH